MLVSDSRSIYLSPVGELEPGTVFAGHRIEMVAGRGGVGGVYKATQVAPDRTAALEGIAGGPRAGPHGGAGGDRGRPARGPERPRAVRARVEGRRLDRSPERHPDLLLRRGAGHRVHRDALRGRRRRAPPRTPRRP